MLGIYDSNDLFGSDSVRTLISLAVLFFPLPIHFCVAQVTNSH